MRVSDKVLAAQVWMERYRAMGYQPLPSDTDKKKPLVRFADYWDAPAPYEEWGHIQTTNIQVMTGRHWGLAVLDLDGEAAVAHVRDHWPRLPRTWKVWHSNDGQDSCHYWFAVTPGPARRKARLWGKWDDAANGGRGDWEPRAAAELLVDRSLIMAPPSIHPRTGNSYGFEVGPKQMRRPAMIPGWLWRLEAALPPHPIEPPTPFAQAGVYRASSRSVGAGPHIRQVIEAVHDKASVAKSWGLRFARDAAESDRWVSVHDFNREDANPSARFNLESGAFWRPGEKCIPFCQLSVELGCYRDWRDASAALAHEFNVK